MYKQINNKSHFIVLDGLRGVAAIIVVLFHLLEAHATSRFDQLINHGYLAVDFFFMLSGFVIAYTYDDRWSQIKPIDFFKRRVIRLAPMVVMGMLIGALLFYFQSYNGAPSIQQTPVWLLIIIFLIGSTALPIPEFMDIRGWKEMHPLNGPAWSLFFEYIANVLYVIAIRKFNKGILTLTTSIAAMMLIHLALHKGDMIGGWSLNLTQLHIGFTRLLFPFLMGVLLARSNKSIRINNSFLCCSLLLTLVLIVPRLGNGESIWINGLYEIGVIGIIFPLILLIGAGSGVESNASIRLSKRLGELSYPLYITHYPLVYIYFAIVKNNGLALQQAWPIALTTFILAIVIAYLCYTWYDEPIRRWLTKKMFKHK